MAQCRAELASTHLAHMWEQILSEIYSESVMQVVLCILFQMNFGRTNNEEFMRFCVFFIIYEYTQVWRYGQKIGYGETHYSEFIMKI